MIPHCMWMLAAICGVVPAPLSSAPDVLLHGLEAATHLKDRTVARIAGIAGMVEPYAGKVLSAVSTTGGAPLYAGMGFTAGVVLGRSLLYVHTAMTTPESDEDADIFLRDINGPSDQSFSSGDGVPISGDGVLISGDGVLISADEAGNFLGGVNGPSEQSFSSVEGVPIAIVVSEMDPTSGQIDIQPGDVIVMEELSPPSSANDVTVDNISMVPPHDALPSGFVELTPDPVFVASFNPLYDTCDAPAEPPLSLTNLVDGTVAFMCWAAGTSLYIVWLLFRGLSAGRIHGRGAQASASLEDESPAPPASVAGERDAAPADLTNAALLSMLGKMEATNAALLSMLGKMEATNAALMSRLDNTEAANADLQSNLDEMEATLNALAEKKWKGALDEINAIAASKLKEMDVFCTNVTRGAGWVGGAEECKSGAHDTNSATGAAATADLAPPPPSS